MKAILSIAYGLLLGAVHTATAAPASATSDSRQRQSRAEEPSTRTRVKLQPANVATLADVDYSIWEISDVAEATFSANELDFTLSSDSVFQGNYYKYNYRQPLPTLGQRLVGTSVSNSEDGSGGTIMLTIAGLPEGEHSLLTWHNSHIGLDEYATVSVAVNGEELASGEPQTGRLNNLWESATTYVSFNVGSASESVEITYTPSGGNNHVYINGFEIDGPAMGQQIGFPEPENKNEWLQSDGTVTASWTAPPDVPDATYDVYLGTSPEELSSVATGLAETSTILDDLNTLDTYYWRVDVVSGDETYVGRTWMFRLAQLAFPGAEGYGRFARGGRGGKVIHVTSLEDTEDEGTLRYALTVAEGPRIVVFDVGGVITTTSRMSVNDQYLTVAGQTAPGKGIVVQGFPVGLTGARDIIFRHMRVRPGKISGQTIDGMGMQGSNNCIFDRCSVGWTIDESFSSRSAWNITLQRTMISEPLNIAGHQNYPEGTEHGYAATIGGDIGSFHHNLIAHAEGRSWSMGGGVDDLAYFAGRLDIRNNVVYNFGGRVTDGGAHKVDFVGNYYKPGPASERTYDLQATYEDGLPGTQQYHCAGNSMLGHFDQDSVQFPPGDGTSITSDIACYADVSIDPAPTYQPFFDEPFFESYVDTQSSTEAYKRVLSDAGASQPVVDDHDARIVRETLDGSTTYVGSVSGKKGIIDHPDDVGGLEDFPSVTRDAAWDADGDGIADWWDGSTGGDGYTVIEGYLNFMAEPHAFVVPGGSVTVDLAALAAGFSGPSLEVSGAELGSVSVSGAEATYEAGNGPGVDRFDISITDDEGSTWTRTFGIAIFEGAEAM